MSDLTLAIGSLIVGVLATIWVSRYYFRRTIDKALTPYVQFFSSIFDGVDGSVRESLKISYKGTPVKDLLEIQFLVANTGERAIRDVIMPLTISIPSGCALLDASILHVSPEGRDVRIEHHDEEVMFIFPLLNSNEFFVTKLLLQGKALPKDFNFTITVDDLPPTLTAVPMPHDLIETDKKREFEVVLFITGVVVFLIGASFAGLISGHWPSLLTCWREGIWSSFPEHWPLLLSTIVSAIPTVLLLVVGPMMMIGAFGDFSFPKRRRFRLPEDIVRRRLFFGDAPFRRAPYEDEKSG